ncbi:unnamed protein product, partial [Heterosigma akashiwo]
RVYPEQLFCGQFSEDGEVFLSVPGRGHPAVPGAGPSAVGGPGQELHHQPPRDPDRRPPAGVRAAGGQRARAPALPPGTRPPHTHSLLPVACRDISWSVISTSFSPDRRWLAYSSWSPYVHLANVFGEYERHEACDFEPPRGHFCLFSIEFSPCSTMIAGGASDN